MPYNKAPSLDEFTTYFYHHCQNIVQLDVWEEFQESRSRLDLLPTLNATFLTLILKYENHVHLGKFEPISIVCDNIITRLCPYIDDKKASHIQFLDDRMLLDIATMQETGQLKSLLSTFLEASGLTLNNDKSDIFFFNTPISLQNWISRFISF